MSPFAYALQELRMRADLRQRELADLVGYEQSHISALELGVKSPVGALLDRLVRELDLTEQEETTLREAADASHRKLYIDADAPQDIYWLLRDLRAAIPSLSNSKARLIRGLLKLPDAHDVDSEKARRIRSRRKARCEM